MQLEALPARSVVATAKLSARDRAILALAATKLAGSTFDDAVRALREAVEESIPSGRVFLLGVTGRGPIIGSVVSGVGIVDTAEGIAVVRVSPGRIQRIGPFR